MWLTGQEGGDHGAPRAGSQTAFCAATSAATLLGVGLNTWLGWWQADPIAALVIAALAAREGIEAWENGD